MVTVRIVSTLQDFSEAADALGSLNLSEGWSSLSLRLRHSESGAQDAELRAQRGDPFGEDTSHQEGDQEEEEDQFGTEQSVSCCAASVTAAASCCSCWASNPDWNTPPQMSQGP